jgi:hypothetical protein
MEVASTPASLPNRMLRAAQLNVHLYEEVEADTTATNQALLVVVIVALASGIGTAVYVGGGNAIVGLIGGILRAILGWVAMSYIMYFVGTRVFRGTATLGELMRTLGFAQSPAVLTILAFIPVLGWLVAIAAVVWTWIASFVGIRQALDLDNGKTAGTVIIGIVAYLVIMFLVGLILPGSRIM